LSAGVIAELEPLLALFAREDRDHFADDLRADGAVDGDVAITTIDAELAELAEFPGRLSPLEDGL